MGTTLSRVILPGTERAAQYELYYRPSGAVQAQQDGLFLEKGSSVRFDSYFNAFFYPKYLAYTQVTEVAFRLCIRGCARFRVLCTVLDGSETVLYEENVPAGESLSPAFRLSGLPPDGMLFFEICALSGPVLFLGGQYETSMIPMNRIKVAAVICTYRREAYVVRNLKQLTETVLEKADCPVREQVDVFVVDNGKTLTLEENDHVRLFPNKNCGGSGGFTRGLIEAYQRQGTYTHVLLMDDDISFESETLVKTVQLLRYARELDRPLCIGGQMLMEDKPTVQFEAGALLKNGGAAPLHKAMDLSDPKTLLRNSEEYSIQYNGWWYFCLPLSAVDEVGLPLPFFIKADDMEYCLRMRPYVLLMNGIGVWHRAFTKKYSAHLEYYLKRNELVTSALHGNGAGVISGLRKLVQAAGKAALIGDTRAIGFLLHGYRDFLKGPDLFLETDSEVLNHELLAEMKKPGKSRLASIFTDPFRLLPVMAAFIRNYRKAQTQYQKRFGELTNMNFWRGQLGLEDQP